MFRLFTGFSYRETFSHLVGILKFALRTDLGAGIIITSLLSHSRIRSDSSNDFVIPYAGLQNVRHWAPPFGVFVYYFPLVPTLNGRTAALFGHMAWQIPVNKYPFLIFFFPCVFCDALNASTRTTAMN